MHVVGVLALHGVVPFDLAIPCDVFQRACLADGTRPYEVRVCGEARRVQSRPFAIHVQQTLESLDRADTIIVPGVEDASQPVSTATIAALKVCDGTRHAPRINLLGRVRLGSGGPA